MDKYVLISVNGDAEILTEMFDTHEAAKAAMLSECLKLGMIGNKDDLRTLIRDGNADFGSHSAWIRTKNGKVTWKILHVSDVPEKNDKWYEQIIVATESDGFETTNLVINLLVKKSVDIDDAVKSACEEYCKTDEGKEIYKSNCYCFNWGDFNTYVPNSICEKYGIMKIAGDLGMHVTYNEQLVS